MNKFDVIPWINKTIGLRNCESRVTAVSLCLPNVYHEDCYLDIPTLCSIGFDTEEGGTRCDTCTG